MANSEMALIFGGGGQDGFYLRRLCEQRGMRVVCASRSSASHAGDIGEPSYVDELMRSTRPDYVFHLAARSSASHDALRDNHRAIAGGTLNVCEAAERHCPEARVFITGSGLQFANDGQPIDEHRPFAATSAYAVERIHSVYAARYYRSRGLRTYVGYLFHHDSPLRDPRHLSMKIVAASKAIAAGSRDQLELGDLDAEKEWAFAGDVVAGMLTLVQQDDVTEAVIGTGAAHPVSEWLELCFARVNLDWRDHVCPIEGFRSDFRRLVSDPGTIQRLGWRPAVSMPALCAMMMAADAIPRGLTVRKNTGQGVVRPRTTS